MNTVEFKQRREDVIKLAKIVLPKASEDQDPVTASIGAMGAIPDTFEWLVTKINFLTPDDYEGLREWQVYIVNKANAIIRTMAEKEEETL